MLHFPLATVLVAVADPNTRDLYSLMLSDVAEDVQVTDDGRMALAKALKHPPDLLVTEAHVPYVDGYALCRALRHDPSTARMRIILATSDAATAATAGADAVLIKPFSAGVLRATIRMLFVGRRSRDGRLRNSKR
jgi:DNA-binding response OmpR family regulator